MTCFLAKNMYQHCIRKVFSCERDFVPQSKQKNVALAFVTSYARLKFIKRKDEEYITIYYYTSTRISIWNDV